MRGNEPEKVVDGGLSAKTCSRHIASKAKPLIKQLSDQHSSLRFTSCLLMGFVST